MDELLETAPQTSLDAQILAQLQADEITESNRTELVLKRYELEQSELPKTPFGIKKSELKGFSFNVLSGLYHGIHNLRIPVQMLAVLNTDEKLAKYLGAGMLKGTQAFQLLSQERKGFIEVVKTIDDVAYSVARGIEKKWKKQFPARSGDQKARLNALDENVKNEFLKSFYEPNNRNYHDPNSDGRDRSMYASPIRIFLQKRQREQELFQIERA